MRTVRTLVVGMLYSGLSFAGSGDPDWLCKEESSQRRGNAVLSCGVGSGEDENEARTRAFEHAQAEFNRICSISEDCKSHMVFVNPKRTVCRKGIVKDYTCYRLVAFEIGGVEAETPRRIVKADSGAIRRQLPDTGSSSKIRIGMTKKQLISALGYPAAVDDSGKAYGPEWAYTQFVYSGTMCDFGTCTVTLKSNKVVSHRSIRPEFTDAFE